MTVPEAFFSFSNCGVESCELKTTRPTTRRWGQWSYGQGTLRMTISIYLSIYLSIYPAYHQTSDSRACLMSLDTWHPGKSKQGSRL